MLKVLELFAGIGAASKALTNLGIDHEIVDAVEIDKYAIKSFNAIHGTNFEPQDITKWDKDIECDLIMHGSPCQDFSVAGLQAGGDKDSGTRSSLMYETLRIVEKLKPKYVIWENVKNLLSKKHRHNFDAYLEAMEKLGYKNYYQVLNAKHYGVPQNRERVFTVSILCDKIVYDDYNSNVRVDQDTIGTLTTNCGAQAPRNGWKIIEEKINFQFPEPIPLEKKLKDVLENKVDEKFYLTNEQTRRLRESSFNQQKARENELDSVVPTLCARDYKDPQCVRIGGLYDSEKTKHQAGSVYDPEGLCATLSTMQGGNQEPIVAIRTANKQGYDVASDGDGIDLSYPNSTTKRGRVGHSVCKTLPTTGVQGVLEGTRIRKLTPKECWRLMGFDDESFDKAARVNSNTQLYKQAGNSIVVDVLMAIFEELFKDGQDSRM